MTLAGGRDVFAGKLAQPDEWSFNSEGRVWINQSWGTGVLYYLGWKQLGYISIVLIKGGLLVMTALFMVLATRQLGASLVVAMIVAAYMIYASSSFIDMRANAIGLTFLVVLLSIIYWSYGHPQRIWLAVVLLVAWAHLHGSYIFGIAMLGLWTVICLAVLVREGNWQEQLACWWPLPAATLLSILLAAVTSPFGITNLTQPFTLMGLFRETEWPIPSDEMKPMFGDKGKFFAGTPWYLFGLGCVVAPLVLKAVIRPPLQRPAMAPDPGYRACFLFTLVLSVITVAMSFQARRFVPVSLFVMTPLAGCLLQQLFNDRRFAWLTGIAIVAAAQLGELTMVGARLFSSGTLQPGDPATNLDPRLVWGVTGLGLALSPLVAVAVIGLGGRGWSRFVEDHPSLARRLAWMAQPRQLAWAPVILAFSLMLMLFSDLQTHLRFHHKNNAGIPAYDLFGRLVYLSQFPDEAVEFLTENQISGRVLNEWRWEGFLYWHDPQLDVMLGGRSRQIYSAQAALAWIQAQTTQDDSVHRDMGLELVIIPAALDNGLCQRIFLSPTTSWRIIFCDGRSIVAANQDLDRSRQYIEAADAGRLRYPSVRAEKYSSAARRLALSSNISATEILEACTMANAEFPELILYQLLYINMAQNRIPPQAVISYSKSELDRLQYLDYHRPLGLQILRCREYLASRLASFYFMTNPPRNERAEYWQDYARQVTALINRVVWHSPRGLPLVARVIYQIIDSLSGGTNSGRPGNSPLAPIPAEMIR